MDVWVDLILLENLSSAEVEVEFFIAHFADVANVLLQDFVVKANKLSVEVVADLTSSPFFGGRKNLEGVGTGIKGVSGFYEFDFSHNKHVVAALSVFVGIRNSNADFQVFERDT